MKRPLLTLVCCLPLLFSAPSSFSLNLIGPSGEQAVSYEQYGPISSVETLWGIASKLRPDDSVTTQQTLVAIYKINPSAFYKGDINKIIPQSVIKVPSLEFIQEQTAKEAAALINKYSPQKRSGTLQSKQPKTAKVTLPKQPPRPVPEIAAPENPKSAPEKIVDKEALATLKNELQSLRNEFEVVNEQLLVETEANQTLKLKLQPLYEQIDSLKKQLDSELLTHSRLQKMVDDYRAQLDAVKARPFSGEGLLNEILRLITSSLTNLLIVIVSPILILLTIFAVIMRLYSKHLLEAQEQELAESTARLMEESGKFDSLLTDDICEETELDFTSDDSLIQDAIKEEQVNESELVSLEDEYKEIDLT
ncbi:MAG: hypothetical protein OQK77_14325, partial [Psychromonas sp.]|nr:hypothetical protein [Psychromonas sp.]